MKESLEFVRNLKRSIDELVRKEKYNERRIAEFFPNHAMKIDDSEYYRQAEIKHARRLDKIASKEIDKIVKKMK
jgi:hypothetical protein